MKSKIALLAVTLFVIPAILPLFKSGFFTMHDDQQVVRLAGLDQAITDGQFPPRWVSNLGFGYGYPLFIFYPPLVYYLGEIFHLTLQTSYIFSIKAVFATAFFGAAISMYLWARHHFGRKSGFLAALFYTYAPYHALDAYVRGALAELFSFVWLPLILLSVDKIFTSKTSGLRKTSWGIVYASSYALLMITHNLVALPFSILIAIYIALKIPSTSVKSWLSSLLNFAAFTLLGLGIAAFFWLPALAEKQFTLVDNILLTQRYTYSLHFVQPHQLWNSLWGFAGSAPPGEIDGFSFKIGKLHIVFSSLVFLYSLAALVAKKRKFPKKHWLLTSVFLLLFLSAWMTTEFSSIIWNNFRPLQFLQFPWRFLTFTALFSSFLAGSSAWLLAQFLNNLNWLKLIHPSAKDLIFHLRATLTKLIKQSIKLSATKIIVNQIFLAIYIIFLSALLFIPNLKLFKPQTHLKVDDAFYISDDFAKWTTSKTSFEFAPKGIATKIQPSLNITQPDITREQIATTPILALDSDPEIVVLENKAHRKQFSINTKLPTRIQINTFNFPGWKLLINNKKSSIDDANPLKLISFPLFSGSHTVKLELHNTPVRTTANIISLASIILIFALTISNKRKPRNKIT